MATKIYKAAHTGSGHYGKIVKVINTDSAGVGANALALHLGSTCIYKKTMAFNNSGITGYSISTSGDPQYLEPWSCVLTPQSGYQALPWNTKVLMAGVDITDTSYDKSTGTISISSVTGDISIEAEAVMMSSEYEPVEYISSLFNTGNASQGFNLGIYPTEKTQIKLVMEQVIDSGRYIVNLYREDSGWGYRNRSSNAGTQCYFYWCGKSSGNRNYQLETGVKATITCDKGAWKVEHENGYNYGYTFNSEGVEYTASKALYLMGNGYSANNPTGRIYRFTHGEDDVLQDDYIPAKNIATGQFGLYKLISGTFLSKSNALWLGKVVLTDRTLANCSISRLSTADTGTTIFAAVGETWSIKITPSSGYTFVGGTTPQVLIDGDDVTSQVVTDNGDGTYNVTIANVEDKPIEITARCSEIINVQGSQTYTPSVTVGTAYTAILTPGTGYQMLPWNTVVMDNGVDITSAVYNKDTGIVSIANVSGVVTITAESVEMSSEYTPLEYVANGYVILNYYVNNKSVLELDLLRPTSDNYALIYGIQGNSSASVGKSQGLATSLWWAFSGNNASFYYPNATRVAAQGMKTNIVNHIVVDYPNKVVTYTDFSNNRRSIVQSGGSDNFSFTQKLAVFRLMQYNNVIGANYPLTNGEIHKIVAIEDDVIIHEWIPAFEHATQKNGFHDIIDGTFTAGVNLIGYPSLTEE